MFGNMSDSELTDYFAGEALKGLLSNETYMMSVAKRIKDVDTIREVVSDTAYQYAKTMMRIRNTI